jgi:hypothetical protein
LDKNLNLTPKVTKINHYACGIATGQQKGNKLIIAQPGIGDHLLERD